MKILGQLPFILEIQFSTKYIIFKWVIEKSLQRILKLFDMSGSRTKSVNKAWFCEICRWREPVPTRVLNPNASEASYKPKQHSYKPKKTFGFFGKEHFLGEYTGVERSGGNFPGGSIPRTKICALARWAYLCYRESINIHPYN